MYLSTLKLKNFRCFDGEEHTITFNKGITVLVGENDAGKSAIMDAIKIVLGTTDMNWHRLEIDDFYNEDITSEIEIICKFEDLSEDERGAFLECLTYENSIAYLYLHWKCRYLTSFTPPRPVVSISTGKIGDGASPSVEAKELLRITYLRALRDAYSDMQAGRSSRLSQIMQHVSIIDKGIDKYEEGTKLKDLSILGIANLSNDLLSKNPTLDSINKDMTQILSEQLLLKRDTLKTQLEVAGDKLNDHQKKMALLEKLDLTVDKNASSMQGKAGLGTSNIMSMACELLLHKEAKGENKSCFLLIEEPEAHIHAQRQLKLIQSFEIEAEAESNNRQIIITTHSPLIASIVKLDNIVVVKQGKAYPLAKEYTLLDDSDYMFLEKYLDATKANLFFARSVIMVEGPGEALLLPTIAKLLNYSFTDYGVSLVDVRSTGLRRYARIFQRKKQGEELDINIACITDRDVMPDCAPKICINSTYTNDKSTWPPIAKRQWRAESDYTPTEADAHIIKLESKANGQKVKTFIAGHWTLEYDLAYIGLADAEMSSILINSLIIVSYAEKNQPQKRLEFEQLLNTATSIEEKASYFYSFFTSRTASKADFAQQFAYQLESKFKGRGAQIKDKIPKYLIDAIEYAIKG